MWPQLTLASVLVVAGHTATFVIAARVAGSTAPLGELIALLMVIQIAAGIPLSIGGWGPREGAAAWAFAAAGLGAANGVTVSTLYAVLMLAAVTPGAGLLLGDAIRRRRGPGHPGEPGGPGGLIRRRRTAPAYRPGATSAPRIDCAAPWVLAGRPAREIKLVGDVDQLARSQLPPPHGQPVGQVRRVHPVLAAPQRVLDRAQDAAQEVSLIARVVPIRAGAYDPVRRACRQRRRPRSPQMVEQVAARSAFTGGPP